MSNVKVNGNTYNGVASVKLALADGTGFATYAEGAVTSDIADMLLSGAELCDMTNNTVSAVNLNVFYGRTCGTVNFTNAAEVFGSAERIAADNILLPKVTMWGYRNYLFTTLRNCSVPGTVDLSGITSVQAANQSFYGSVIGTLLLGKMQSHNGMFQTAKITNLVWNNPDLSAANMGGSQGLGCIDAVITNAYVPDALYDEINALIDADTLTTVANLYKISEWSGK